MSAAFRHALLSLGLLVAAAPARGQLAVDRLEIVMVAGSEREGVIGVRNGTTAAVQTTVRLEDWDRSPDGTNRWYEYASRPGSCGGALTVFPRALTMESGTSQGLRVVMDSTAVPRDGCWAAVVLETRPSSAPVDGRDVAFVVRTAVKVYVERPGSRLEGTITRLGAVRDSAATGTAAAADLEVELSNTGTRRIEAHGTIEWRRADNSVAARSDRLVVYALPGARQVVRAPIPKLAPGTYVALAMFDYGGDEIAAAQLEYRVP